MVHKQLGESAHLNQQPAGRVTHRKGSAASLAPKSLELYHGTEPESITYPAETNPLILPLLSNCDRKALKCPHPTPENGLQTDTWIAFKKKFSFIIQEPIAISYYS